MMNTTFFILCALLICTTCLASTSDISGPAESFLPRKSGKDQDFELAGYDAAGYDSLISMDDDYQDDMYTDDLSFSTNDRQESSIETRAACSYQCDKKCYQPYTHQCCNGIILLNGYWTCSKCVSPSSKTCDGRCYPDTGFQCCYDKVIPNGWPCCPHHCNGKCFDAQKDKCCHNRIISRSTVCCELGKYCGDNCYNSTVSSCCNGQAIDKGAICCTNKCGNTCYSPNTHGCCHDRVTVKDVPCISGSGNPVRITSGLNARRVGCFRDTGNRAIPTLEGKSHLLIPHNYQARRYAIEKCALAAAKRGWNVFAVQHQGWCASSSTAAKTYNKYGPYNTCSNGKGGPWGNDVYVLEGNASKKTTSGDICVFPFIYKGKSYNDCTNVDSNTPWCAITPSYDVDKLSGDC